jgi:hypothetical protein
MEGEGARGGESDDDDDEMDDGDKLWRRDISLVVRGIILVFSIAI